MRRPDCRDRRGRINSHAFLFPNFNIIIHAEFGSRRQINFCTIMQKGKKDQELQSRREFFRRVSTKTLPILGAVVLGPAISLTTLTSCGCDECSAMCMDNCEGGCVASCQGSAKTDSCSSCASSCSNTCSNTCSNSAAGAEPQDEISPASGKVGGYEYVDLGLSVKWARYNIGASKPESKGGLFGYADPYGNLSGSELNNDEAPWNICGTSQDAATIQWGNLWKLPTVEQIQELRKKCTWSWFQYKGMSGAKVIGPNGNSIFLPAAGYKNALTGNTWPENYYAQYGSGGRNSNWKTSFVIWFHQDENKSNGLSFLYVNEYTYYKSSIRPVTTASSGGGGGCTGSSCSSNCANNSTSSGCSSCATSCTNSCKTQCDYNCAATCENHCGGGCNTSCGGTCTYVSAGSGCSGCARSCYNQCYTSCNYACSNNCESSCVHGSK